ncbi:MAG: hypothetical protein HYX75_02205 [Acidobacteria bacterium]|nr:hypothetical protein [Acidobacteriota bacterium]
MTAARHHRIAGVVLTITMGLTATFIGPGAKIGSAAPDIWRPIGPAGGGGGDSGDIVFEPGNSKVVYLDGPRYRSVDGGVSWTPINSLPPQTRPTCLAIDPTTPDVLYAGIREYEGDLGVLKSTDGGSSWSYVNEGLTELSVTSLAVDPRSPSRLYAATRDGVYRTENGGARWVASGEGVPSRDWGRITIDPFVAGTVYLVLWRHGVYKSLDHGRHWAPANNCMTQAVYSGVSDIAIDKRGRLFLATSRGVYRSTDGAASWTRCGPGPFSCGSIAISSNYSQVVYVSVYRTSSQPVDVFRSGDGGATWSPVPTGDLSGHVSHLAVDPNDSSTVLASSLFLGVLRTVDAGRRWGPSAHGLPGIEIREILFDPRHDSVRYAVPRSFGLFKSQNAGGSWSILSEGMPTYGVRSLVAAPNRPRTLYGLGEGVQRSKDGGLTWESGNTGLSYYLSARTLRMDPLDPDHLIVTTLGGVFETPNGALRWRLLSAELAGLAVTALEFDPHDPQTIYAFTREEGQNPPAMYLSADGGVSWTQLGSGLPANGWVNRVALDPRVPGRLYAATTDGIYRSDDGGRRWFPLRKGWPSSPAGWVIVDPVDPNRIYGGTNGYYDPPRRSGGEVDPNKRSAGTTGGGTDSGGVYAWDPSAKTWVHMSEGLDPDASETVINALSFDPFHARTLYACTVGGIFVRTLTR